MSESKGVVLIVEDEVRILRFLRMAIRLVGYEVETAMGGEDALRLASLAEPDIVLLDMLMFPMDGFEVLRRLRAVSKVPVIAMSAFDSARQESMKLGADVFLRKPFRPEEVVREIEISLASGRTNGPPLALAH